MGCFDPRPDQSADTTVTRDRAGSVTGMDRRVIALSGQPAHVAVAPSLASGVAFADFPAVAPDQPAHVAFGGGPFGVFDGGS